MVSSGYDAVKAVSSTSKVIVHISNGYDNSLFRWMFDGLTTNNARFDVIGMSLYPTTANWQTLNNQCLVNMNDMITRYNKEIMICEVGMDVGPAPSAKKFLSDLILKTKGLANSKGLGVFYWEPEAYNDWQGYTKGAFDMTGKPTVAMDAFLENNSPAVGTNLLLNSSFDADAATTQTPQAWSESGAVTASSTSSGGGWNADGNYYLGHYQAAAYQVRTFQTVILPNGHYTLSAWAIRGNGQNTCQVYASGFGSPDLTANIPYNNVWAPVGIPDINVTSGQVTIGFYSDANAGNWLDVDSVRLVNLTALPVSLLSYNAVLQPGGHVQLSWKTASESNNKNYTVQRSTNGSDFTEIGQVAAKTVLNREAEYVFIDEAPVAEKTNYYRLMQVDVDGRTTSLGVKLINIGNLKTSFSIYPNPARGAILVKLPGIAGKALTISLYSSAGRQVFSRQVIPLSNEFKLSLPGIAKASYFLKISGDNISESREIIIR